MTHREANFYNGYNTGSTPGAGSRTVVVLSTVFEKPTDFKINGQIAVPVSTGNDALDESRRNLLSAQIEAFKKTGLVPSVSIEEAIPAL